MLRINQISPRVLDLLVGLSVIGGSRGFGFQVLGGFGGVFFCCVAHVAPSSAGKWGQRRRNGLTKSLGCRVAFLLEGVFQRTPPMNAAAVVAFLPEWLDVIFDGENADRGMHRLSAVAEVSVPCFVADPKLDTR